MPGLHLGRKKDKTTAEGIYLEPFISLHNFHKLISEPLDLLPHAKPCIDLIFTDQTNVVVISARHSSLNSKCHHHITHCKLNRNIEYPSSYERLVVWDYKKGTH